MDGDGKVDLVTGNYASDTVSVLRNRGDGSFAAQLTYAVGTRPLSVLAADVDGDGALDLVAANSYSDLSFYAISVLKNLAGYPAPRPWTIDATDNDDQILIRPSPSDSRLLEAFVNTSTHGPPTHTLERRLLASLTVNARGGNDTLTVCGDIPVRILFNGGAGQNTLWLDGANMLFQPDTTAGTQSLSLRLSGGASATFRSARRLASLDIGDGCLLTLAPGGQNTLAVDSLAIDAGGRLNLNNNNLIVGTASLATIQALVRDGFNGGGRNGTGIFSDAIVPGRHALGYAAGDDPMIWHLGGELDGVPFGPSAAIVRFTWAGDGNLDRVVGFADLGLLLVHYGGAATWSGGDFNHDGVAGFADLALLADNYGSGVLSGGGLLGATDAPRPAPELRLSGPASSRPLKSVDFGTVTVSATKAGPRRTIRITNSGDVPLALRLRKLPPGFSLVEPLAPILMPGQSDTFTIRLSRRAPASIRDRAIRIDSNDPLARQVRIPLMGVVAPPPLTARPKVRAAPAAAPSSLFNTISRILPPPDAASAPLRQWRGSELHRRAGDVS